MKKYAISIIIILSISCIAKSQEDLKFWISEKNRIKSDIKYSQWAALEMLLLEHGYTEMKGLSEKKRKSKVLINDKWVEQPGTPTFASILDELNYNNITYTHQQGITDTSILKNAYQNNLGAMITLKNGQGLIVIDYNDKEIKTVDTIKIDYWFRHKKEWLDDNWTGNAIVITKKVDRPTKNEIPDAYKVLPLVVPTARRLDNYIEVKIR